jgi:hypothetical protein
MVKDCRPVDEGFAVVEHQRGYADQGIESAHLIRVAENREQIPLKGDSQHRKGDADTTHERRINCHCDPRARAAGALAR